MLQAIARQPLGVIIGFVGASALFLLVFGLAFASGRVLATHGGSGNVHVRNGLGETATTNATGNLIVGYNEDFLGDEDRSGSHNLVVGQDHGYSNYGGFVAGLSNEINGPYASVSGGQSNTSSGTVASVSGGFDNTASGNSASVSGGQANTASNGASSISGGASNTASGGGGAAGSAPGIDDWVAGALFQDS